MRDANAKLVKILNVWGLNEVARDLPKLIGH
jgi:hypothetical protein